MRGCELGQEALQSCCCIEIGRWRDQAHSSLPCAVCSWRQIFSSANIAQEYAWGVCSSRTLWKQLGKQLVIVLASFPCSTADVQKEGGNWVGVFWALASLLPLQLLLLPRQGAGQRAGFLEVASEGGQSYSFRCWGKSDFDASGSRARSREQWVLSSAEEPLFQIHYKNSLSLSCLMEK